MHAEASITRRSPLAATSMTMNNSSHSRTAVAPARSTTSTLIEFPGTARPAQPAWRKELSLRVREIQERRAREAAGGDSPTTAAAPATTFRTHAAELDANSSQQLGLVPPPAAEERPVNPIVTAALARLERARQNVPPQPPAVIAAEPTPAEPQLSATETIEVPDARSSHTATNGDDSGVKNNVNDEQPVRPPSEIRSAPTASAIADNALANGIDVNSRAFLKHKEEEAARSRAKLLGARELVAKQFATTATDATPATRLSAVRVAPTQPTQSAAAAAAVALAPDQGEPLAHTTIEVKPRVAAAATTTVSTQRPPTPARRVVAEIIDETALTQRELEEAARDRKNAGDFATPASRIAAGVIDLVAVGFFATPVAAFLEWTYSDWSGTGVRLTMLAAWLLILFGYIAVATAFAGRTWGMALLGLRAVDVETGMIPTTAQAVRRGAGYVGSLVVFGLGFLYALIDPECRGAHDHYSGTIVLRD